MATDTDEPQGDIKLLIDDIGNQKIAMVVIGNHHGNCLDFRLLNKLAQIFRDISSNSSITAVVLTGAGSRDFCSGGDPTELRQLNAHSGSRLIFALHLACTSIQRCPFPVIARIQGACLGMGLQLALYCDFRISAESGYFGVSDLGMGFPYAAGATLCQMIGWGRAREMVMLGQRYRAEDAQRIGLIQQCVTQNGLETAIGQWLARLQNNGKAALRLQKALFTRWAEAGEGNLDIGLWAFVQACIAGEHTALIDTILEKREKEEAVSEHGLHVPSPR